MEWPAQLNLSSWVLSHLQETTKNTSLPSLFDSLTLAGVGEKIDSPMHRDSLFNKTESILSLFLFFSRIWHVCALETRRASLHRICAVRHVHIAWQCVLPPAVFYFRYALIYTVWNAVILDARNSHTDRLSHALCVCLSWSSIVAVVKCTLMHESIFEYFYTKLMYTQSVMFSEQDKTSDISK